MTLHLYGHPLASFCWKVTIALHEAGTPYEDHLVDLSDPGATARFTELWPVGKMPVLHDPGSGRTIPETSIIIEYLDRHHPGPTPLIPPDPDAALEVRLWDRFFDLYVHQPMQAVVLDRIRPEDARSPAHVAEAEATLATAYAMTDARMANRRFACGEGFTLADCAAAPALFYATLVAPPPEDLAYLAAYRARLLDRPSVRRTIDAARPWFGNFPFRERLPPDLWTPDA